jgi:hypothetical protein
MNSTGISFKTPLLKHMFCMIDEYCSYGNDPRNHYDWDSFVEQLKKEHSENLIGILLLIYYPMGRDANPAFAMMFLPKENVVSEDEEIIYYKEIFSVHKERMIVDFIEL